MKYKKFITKILSVFIILLYVFEVFAVATTSDANNISSKHNWPYFKEELSSKAAVVMDADSSIVLFEHNPNKRHFPASLAKIMTAIIVLDKSNGNYDELVTFSYNSVTKDIDRNSVTIGASAGDQLSVKDCLYCLLLPSANDVANALAEHFAGSIKDFALLMNEKAENLGLKNTNFVNPSGLHDDNQYTTASDMAKILQCAMSYPMFMQVSSSVSYRHAPIRKYKNPENSNNLVLNTNSIMISGSKYNYKNATSGKTGHTSAAGYNLAASARKDNMNLICVVLGGDTEKIRFEETKLLFDFHFNNYKSLIIKKFDNRFDDSISTISIDDVNLIESLNITCNENAHITLPKNADENKVQSNISFQVDDIYDKYAIGTINYYYNNDFIGKCTLEGRIVENDDAIYTSQLNLSNSLSLPEDTTSEQISIPTTNSNKLFSTDENGNFVVSNTFILLLIVSISIIIIIAIITFLYTSIFKNPNIPINKIFFRIRRKFK